MKQVHPGMPLRLAALARAARWTEVCGNPPCRTGWLQIFRRRSTPRFEGTWACSPACMERIIAEAVRTQIENWEPSLAERPLRMPLGLILLSRGWINQQDLQEALTAQRAARQGRIGEWLRRLHGISEETIAKGLAIQWNCAVLPSGVPALRYAPSYMPVYLRNRYGLALLREGPDASLYLAGKYRAEHAAARALEHMLGEPVHAAFLEDSAWRPLYGNATDRTELYLPDRDGVVACISELVEDARPTDARLIRIHDHLWLRMWLAARGRRAAEKKDVLFSLRNETAVAQESATADCLEAAKNTPE